MFIKYSLESGLGLYTQIHSTNKCLSRLEKYRPGTLLQDHLSERYWQVKTVSPRRCWLETGKDHEVRLKANFIKDCKTLQKMIQLSLYILTSSRRSWVSPRSKNFIAKWRKSLGTSRSRKTSLLSSAICILFPSPAGGTKWSPLLLRGKESLYMHPASQVPTNSPLHLYSQHDSCLWMRECCWLRKCQGVTIRADVYWILTLCQALFSAFYIYELVSSLQ